MPGLLVIAFRVALILAAAYGVHLLMDWATAKTAGTNNMPLMLGLLFGLLLAYSVLLAIPFMPGIEIGISLLLLRGSDIAPFVYFATVLGLTLAFVVGRSLPYAWIRRVFADLRLERASALVERLEPMDQPARMQHLQDALPAWLHPICLKARYLMLGVLLNLPGNFILGGGGGLAFAAGFSRIFRPLPAVLIFAIAVLPVPLGVWFLGNGIMLPSQ